LERIGDRFGAMLIPGFLLRRVAIWFIGLAALVLAGLVLIPLEGQARLVPALAVFVASLLMLVIGSFASWRSGGDVGLMLAIARGTLHPEQAVREILWRAIERADVAAVGLSFRTFERTSTGRADLLVWLLGHRELHNNDWLTTEILTAELEGGLDEDSSKAVRDPLIAILDSALRREQFDLVYSVTHETLEALRLADPFTTSHAQLMTDVGRTIWLIGDYRGTAPRRTSLPEQLAYMKMIYTMRRRDIWFALLKRRASEDIASFIHFLCLFAEDTQDGDNVYSLYTDVLMDGTPAGVLAMEALRDLANSMRWMHVGDLSKILEGGGAKDEMPPLDPLGKKWNGQFVMLVAAAKASGLSDQDIEDLISTYGVLGDKHFMREVKENKGIWGYESAKKVFERSLRA
jgi:hypothetical protein